jgi:hypothetical protein
LLPKLAEALKSKHVSNELKILFRRRYLAAMELFSEFRGIFEVFIFAEYTLIVCNKKKIWSNKVWTLDNFWIIFHNLAYNSKTGKVTMIASKPLKTWSKNLSNEYIYAEQNPNRTWAVGFQSWPYRSRNRQTPFLKFSLWMSVTAKCGASKSFISWFFLSWGIDYWIKNQKTKSGRITFWIYFHPSAHCAISNLKKRIEELENESKFWYKKYNESLDELEKKDKIIKSRDKRILELEAGKLGEKEDLFLLKTEEEIKKEIEVDQIYLADIQLVLNFLNNFIIKV